MMIRSLLLSIVVSLAVIGCATDGGGSYSGGGSRAASCKAGDQAIASASQCLQDDAACYQLSNDSWCTGERGLSCPTGSSELLAGAPCPRGARCFKASESLMCAVNY